jgi:hypothetical protein
VSCFFFDNCISHKIVEILKLAADARDPTKLVHVRDVEAFKEHGGRGVLDTIWIPYVAKQGWIAVTVDKRVKTKPHERELVESTGIRMVHIAGGFEQLPRWPQIRWFVNHWEDIAKETAKCKEGEQFTVRMNGKAEKLR